MAKLRGPKMKAALNNSSVSVKPSKALISHIRSLKACSDAPPAIKCIRSRRAKGDEDPKPCEQASLLTDKDRDFIKSLDLKPQSLDMHTEEDITVDDKDLLLSVDDLLWVWNKMQENSNSKEPYLHELLMESAIILSQNSEIPRSEELDKRCQILKNQQDNRAYKAITKNVDNVRKQLPEDTVSYQLKQINKQLIAVAQFVISVLAGFLFGFHGIELMVGTLDFGFRLLLGVICSLTIALAELYFLAKKLNEDMQYEVQVENKTGHSKLN